jgi:hypothetical protein
MYTVYLEPLSCQRQRVKCMVAGDKALIDSILGNSKVKDDVVGDITFEDNMIKLLEQVSIGAPCGLQFDALIFYLLLFLARPSDFTVTSKPTSHSICDPGIGLKTVSV